MSDYITRREAIANIEYAIIEMGNLTYYDKQIDNYIALSVPNPNEISEKISQAIRMYYEGNYRAVFKSIPKEDFMQYYRKICELAKVLKLPISTAIENKTLRGNDILGEKILDSKTIICNLNNPEDMRFAAKQFGNSENGYDKAVAVDWEKGYFMTFKDAEKMNGFIANNLASDIEEMLTALSTSGGVGYVATDWEKDVSDFTKSIKAIKNVSTGLTWFVTGIDVIQFGFDPNIDTVTDVIISGIGACGVLGAVISISFAVTKSSLKEITPEFEQAYKDTENHILSKVFRGWELWSW